MTPKQRENERYARGKNNVVELEELILLSKLNNDDFVLDVGCGTGEVTEMIQQRTLATLGLDFSKAGIAECKKKELECSVCDIDAEGIPYEDKSFSVVWATDVIEHLFDPVGMLKEANRVLADSGRLLITVPNDYPLRARAMVGIKGKAISYGVYKKRGVNKHHTDFNYELIEELFNQSGFKVSDYTAIIGLDKLTKRKLLGNWFGRLFIIEATKTCK